MSEGLITKILLWLWCAGCVAGMTWAVRTDRLRVTDATPLYVGLVVMLLASILVVLYI